MYQACKKIFLSNMVTHAPLTNSYYVNSFLYFFVHIDTRTPPFPLCAQIIIENCETSFMRTTAN